MIDVFQKLRNIGVEIERSSTPSFNEPTMPQVAYDVVSQYQSSIMFHEFIRFKPQYPTGLEGKKQTLPLDFLWGIADGNLNIVKANDELKSLDADADLFSIGRCFGGHHICLSSLHSGVYPEFNSQVKHSR
ncbi:hypothetical protein [Photobacterium galatheae]|uniref:Uncharacterized protein n=1 Tax=Photobacterium galatheae TaxID=1654360 RepID=A0A066RPL9_9GAMM|nr:hypothetical protein [Photobacterium galatheae]KDM92289.1 hypothetical protein EA58_07300 [Photobacterium galatheae]MCM0150530.1 hypothetical protein [Photobacterium galatheae]